MSGIYVTPYMPVPKRQVDVVLSQANPVSTTEYSVLAETHLVRILSIYAETTGGTVSELRVNTDIDDVPTDYVVANPGSGTSYFAIPSSSAAAVSQLLSTTDRAISRTLLDEGRKVTVKAATTWTVQNNPLVCRLKYSKW